METHILGIRHHGVGSAKNVLERLQTLKPDVLLVEGPPELDGVVNWIGHTGLTPPVAVLGYHVKRPAQAVFYPFAHFSPEWQAIAYAHAHGIPVRMMDLPLAHGFALDAPAGGPVADGTEPNLEAAPLDARQSQYLSDPLLFLAQIAGFETSEHWWEQHFEHIFIPNSAQEHFEAVLLAMTALRENPMAPAPPRDDLREAYMRKIMRQAEADGYNTCAVVCGAWHAPALGGFATKDSLLHDTKLLRGLPSVPVACTWIPWTNTRLGLRSGYGAGIASPGWAAHQWEFGSDLGIRWLTQVARLFRAKKMDVSTAHIIEAFRLAESLAALRQLSKPGLFDLHEATRAVFCFGDDILLKLIDDELVVGKAIIGKVPAGLPTLPIQSDFESQRKICRLPLSADTKDYELDLRTELDLHRSRLLHRFEVLEIGWGRPMTVSSRGTFKEGWRVCWYPELEIELIEKGFWGNTLEEACIRFLIHKAEQTPSVADLARYIHQAVPAELLPVVEKLLAIIQERATLSSDVQQLMETVGPLVEVGRYGNVRKTDLSAILSLVHGLITRICIGLPDACYGLDEETAALMFGHIKATSDGIALLELPELESVWYQTLFVVLDKDGVHGIISGCTCRLLFDAKQLDGAETARRFGIVLSAGSEPRYAAGWVEGFLKGSGTLLLYDTLLWNILYQWLAALEDVYFLELLPVLRRTFSRFDFSERKQLGEKARQTSFANTKSVDEAIGAFDETRGELSLEVVRMLLGLNKHAETGT